METFPPFLPPCSILPSKLVRVPALCMQRVPGTLSSSQPVPVAWLTSHQNSRFYWFLSIPLILIFFFFFTHFLCFHQKKSPKSFKRKKKGSNKTEQKWLLCLGAATTSLAKLHPCSSRPNSMCLIKVHVNTYKICKGMALCSLAEAEIPVSRLWVSWISVKVQKESCELLFLSVPPGITEWFGLDGTSKDHLIQTLVCLSSIWSTHPEWKSSFGTEKVLKRKQI